MMGKYKHMFATLFKLPDELNEAERKTQLLLSIPIGLIMIFVFCLCFNMMMGLNFSILFLSFSISLILVLFVFYFWDNINKKYKMRSIRSPYPTSYQSFIFLLLTGSPLFFGGLLSVGLATGNFWFGLGGAVSAVFPILVIFLRIRTFSDDSIPVGGGFGFMPLSYWILSWALGFFTVGRGFSGLNFYLIDGSVSLEFVVISIIIGLAVQSVVLFPDKMDRLVPLDLRTKKGFIFMIVLAFILFGLSQFLIMFLTAFLT